MPTETITPAAANGNGSPLAQLNARSTTYEACKSGLGRAAGGARQTEALRRRGKP
jgi:hypothetical protein